MATDERKVLTPQESHVARVQDFLTAYWQDGAIDDTAALATILRTAAPGDIARWRLALDAILASPGFHVRAAHLIRAARPDATSWDDAASAAWLAGIAAALADIQGYVGR